MASRLDQAIKQVLDLCRAHPDGLPQKELDEEIPDVELLMQALNFLLEKCGAEKVGGVFARGESYIQEAKYRSGGEVQRPASEDLFVYQSVARAEIQGIRTADLKRRANLQQPEINEASKNLKGRSLVKSLRTVPDKNLKVYMLFELTSFRDVTGGAWYTDQDFDAEFVDGLADLPAIADAIHISQVGLELEFKRIMNTLLLAGDVEVTMGGKINSSETFCYRVPKSCIQETSALTNIPCGICSVLHECSPGGLIFPREICLLQ